MSSESTKTIMVTGANGYVAGRLVEVLLQEGHTVHAAVRNPSDLNKVEPLLKLGGELPGTLHLFDADLLKEGSYDKAADGCEIIFHTASPFFRSVENVQRDLIDPALNGTRNVLETANRTASVKRVVLTSSCAAIFGDSIDLQAIPNHTIDESMWNTSSSEKHQAYSYSKTLAEQEAWKIADAQDRWKLVVINPSLVIGPGLNPKGTSESFAIFKQIGNGDLRFGAFDFNIGCVDVRDLAVAHYRAGILPNAEGRHIISAHNSGIQELASLVKKNYPQYPIRTHLNPKWLVKLIAPMIGLSREEVRKNIGYPWKADNSKSIKELNMSYRPLEESVCDFMDFLIDGGHVKRK